ncbi:hypothetical protein T265_08159 [Opisthorchis viverrini]|uniref:Uncharacterized protein n=1 Tax=Opisthorchis viverrini TaxID=6198 RepID=A0A075A9D3_OPIVI|nr:hypothetical protein T265_08159 [Opisthorchis viverrini]KER24119.1 hypothetical protein T265_08159 [Opisthorchis viverrini]
MDETTGRVRRWSRGTNQRGQVRKSPGRRPTRTRSPTHLPKQPKCEAQRIAQSATISLNNQTAKLSE